MRENVLYLHTKDTSYIINIKEYGKLEQVYYGKRIRENENLNLEIQTSEFAHSVLYRYDESVDTFEKMSLEYGESGKGDFREPAISLRTKMGYTTDFIYQSHEFREEREGLKGLPFARGQCKTLIVTLYDSNIDIELKLYYHAFYESNVITRHARIKNLSDCNIEIDRFMSFSLDLDDDGYELVSFEGDWANEMQKSCQGIKSGIYINDSKVGTSSNRHNPFFMLKRDNASEYFGEAYAFNLIYSANHAEVIEKSPSNKLRVLSGINPHNFSYSLLPNEVFDTPEAVLTYTDQGLNGVSRNMHSFVIKHVIPERFQKKERPILINNWEATYFDFSKKKLLNIAEEAKDLGIELFVLDDGWFGHRNDEKSSLGDWIVNEEKIGGSLRELVDDINALDLQFGIWFEPEMLSEDSELFIRHPEYRLGAGRISTGRNQYILDLTKSEVCEYIIHSLSNILESANISYVKWDMNRNFSDVYSDRWENQGEIIHRYVMGLYYVFNTITERFPNILFEGCSAGGNRFDLGILSYMPQIWASDNTDGNMRVMIQKSLSYGYPQSSWGAHVSASPNHQTRKVTPLETRFHISCFGNLGYELDLTKLRDEEKEIVKQQIMFYKSNRKLLQFGEMYRLETNEDKTLFLCTNEDKSEAVVAEFYDLQKPNPSFNKIVFNYLNKDYYYHMNSREQYVMIDEEKIQLPKEIYSGYGDLLNSKGIKLHQQVVGKPREGQRFIGDFGSTIYKISV